MRKVPIIITTMLISSGRLNQKPNIMANNFRIVPFISDIKLSKIFNYLIGLKEIAG